MFGVGLPELIVIGVIVLLVFGPEKLPEITKKAGQLAGQFKKTSDSVRREFYNSVYTPAEQLKRDLVQTQRELTTVSNTLKEETTANKAATTAQNQEKNGE